MPTPGGIPTVTVTGTYKSLLTDAALTGSVMFVAPPNVVDASGNRVFPNGQLACPLVNGTFTAVVPATDYSGYQVQNWVYTIVEFINGARGRRFDLPLPQGTPTVDLADVAPVSTSQWTGYVLLGQPNGAATLDATGKLTAAQRANVVPIPQADVTNLVSDLAGKAATVHTHAEADVTGLLADLAAKAALLHTHAQSDVSSLVADLAAKAAAVHTHAQADITGLVSALATLTAALAAKLPAAAGTATDLAVTSPGQAGVPLTVTGHDDGSTGNLLEIRDPQAGTTPVGITRFSANFNVPFAAPFGTINYISMGGVRYYGGATDPDPSAPNDSVWWDASTTPVTIRKRVAGVWTP